MTSMTLFFAAVWTSPLLGETVRVVTTLPVFASVAQEIGGDRVTVEAISEPREDAHFVKPKPSFALMLRDADVFVTTGLDLELWAPVLVDKSGNRSIRDGQPGFVSASQNVPLLDVPGSTSREGGDVHAYGNPHLHTSPLNVKIIAANIAAGLERVDPSGAEDYRRRLADFQHRIDVALYGKELVTLLGAEVLDPLARSGQLIDFLGSKELEGRPLIGRLGGWLGRARSLRGQKIVTYHKNWVYLVDLLGLDVVGYVEPKPGIPPSARHVKELIETMQENKVPLVLSADYFDPRKPAQIADRTGARVVIAPLQTGGAIKDYFALVDAWVGGLADAVSEAPSGRRTP
ncbi:MAG: metal ABC transporter substrate-binding protein [Thermoanaerobaculia bacterium]|nr:metal ABC transporter substrate-binding protein [Thermoanaerobaculia bacterium]